MNPKKIEDETKFWELYNLGMSDTKIASAFKCAVSTVTNFRQERGAKTNTGLFAWQRKLRPSHFKMIPEKYRDKSLVI